MHKKLNFIPISQLKTKEQKKAEENYASFNAKHGMLTFSMGYSRDKNLNGAPLRLFVDGEKKVIGWQKVKELDMTADKMIRVAKSYNKGGTVIVTVPKAAVSDFLRVDPTKKFKKMPVQVYKDLIMGDISYVELK